MNLSDIISTICIAFSIGVFWWSIRTLVHTRKENYQEFMDTRDKRSNHLNILQIKSKIEKKAQSSGNDEYTQLLLLIENELKRIENNASNH